MIGDPIVFDIVLIVVMMIVLGRVERGRRHGAVAHRSVPRLGTVSSARGGAGGERRDDTLTTSGSRTP